MQVARDSLKLRDFPAFFDLGLGNLLIGTCWMSFNEKFVCIMPDCIVQQIGISCLRKMNMMTFAVVQSVTVIPSLKMLHLNILNVKTKYLSLIILSSIGDILKPY